MELVDNIDNTLPCRLDRSLLRQNHNLNHHNYIHRNRYRRCCLCLQIQFSYLIGLFSSTITAIALILYLRTFQQQWLTLLGLGILFILIGSSIYCNGVNGMIKYNPELRILSSTAASTNASIRQSTHSNYNKRTRSKRFFKSNTSNSKRSARESHIFESHLSINMLPQCFTNLDLTSTSLLSSSSQLQRQISNNGNNSRQLLTLSTINAQQLHSNNETVVDVHSDNNENHRQQQIPPTNSDDTLNHNTTTTTLTTAPTNITTNANIIDNHNNDNTNEFDSCSTDLILVTNDDDDDETAEQSLTNDAIVPSSDRFNSNNVNNEDAPPSYEDVITDDNGLFRTL